MLMPDVLIQVAPHPTHASGLVDVALRGDAVAARPELVGQQRRPLPGKLGLARALVGRRAHRATGTLRERRLVATAVAIVAGRRGRLVLGRRRSGRGLRRRVGRRSGSGLRNRLLRLRGLGRRTAVAAALAVGLVDLEGIDAPVGVLERRRVVGHEVLARLAAVRRAARLEGAAGPVAAEGGVEDEVLRRELAVPVTAVAGPLGRRFAPIGRVRVVGQDVTWRAALAPPPDADAAGGPLHGEHGAFVGVQAAAVEAAVRVVERAALVAVGERIAIRALGLQHAIRASGNTAAGAAVERHGIGRGIIDVLNDVDLATVGPVGADRPATKTSVPTSSLLA